MPKPTDLNELVDALADKWVLLEKDPRQFNQCKEFANIAGKMINAAKVHVVTAALRGVEPDMPFLGEYKGQPLKATSKLISG